MNNRGYAISGILYSILLLFLTLMCGMLTIFATTKFSFDKLRSDIIYKLNGNIGEDYIKVDFANYTINNEYESEIDFLEGVSLVNKKGSTVSSQMINYSVEPTFDINTNGTYVVTYTTIYNGSEITATRNIMVSDMENYNFGYTGAVQSYQLEKAGVYKIEVWGAAGGGRELSLNNSSGLGGKGGYSVGVLNTPNPLNLYVYVGGVGNSSTSGEALGGFNGGGNGYASLETEPGNGGGGATDIRIEVDSLYARLIVAGGGGGGGQDFNDSGGYGGGMTAGSGMANGNILSTNAGATLRSPGSNATYGIGSSTNKGDGGGGGGGYFGGGGTTQNKIGSDCYSGGGGSGFIWNKANFEAGYTNNSITNGNWLLSKYYYLTSGVTIAGNEEMPNYANNTTMIGNSNNGYARIIPLILKNN